MLGNVVLLVGFLILGISASFDQFTDINKKLKAFAMSVEHVVYQFRRTHLLTSSCRFGRARVR